MQNNTTIFNPTVTVKNANSQCANMVAFINANGGLGKWALQLQPTALNNGALFGGINAKGSLWHGMAKCQNNNPNWRGLILWACVNGVNGKLPTNAKGGFKGACNQQQLAKFISTSIPTKIGSPVPLTTINNVHAISGSSVLSVGTATHCNQNAVGALFVGAFSYIFKHTYGTSFAKLVPIAK
tara:strand:- start:250 stop:798 length:549 start_codon:yes stop_codon:yes gene_type:complete